jgi:threonine dehydratase
MISFEEFTLANGLKVIVHEDPDTTMAVVDVIYNVGSRDEDENLTGFAHLFEHLMFGGSENIPSFDTPLQKVEAVRFHGQEKVKIKLVGETFDEAYAAARAFCEKNQAIFIPPFDDFDIIAGQATVCLEIVHQVPQPMDYLVLAVGGGGIAAGSALVLDALSPATKLIAVEPAQAASLAAARAAGEPVTLPAIDSFVDGAAVKRMGEKTFAILKNKVDRVLEIEKKHLAQTMLDLYQFYGMIVEPAGALSVAGLANIADEIKGKTVVCVISGGNFDPKRFPEIKDLVKNG